MGRPSRSIPMQRLQAVDRFLGRVVCLALQPWRWLRGLRPRREPARVERVLLIKFWGIGSLQLLTPAVRTLRRRHRGAELVLLTLSDNEPFVRGLGVFDGVVGLDIRSNSWFGIAGRILGLVHRLRRERFDRIYDFEFFTRFSAVVSFVTGAPCTVGFGSTSAWRGQLHTEDVPFNRYWHVARNFRALAGGENGGEVAAEEVDPFVPTAEDRAGLAAKLARGGLELGEPYVVLNPNAGSLSLERRWPQASFAEVAQRVNDGTRATTILIGSASEREYTAGVRTAMREEGAPRLLDMSGELTIGELCTLLAGAQAVVSNDSGPMHLSAALGAPTLGLFGPETPMMYEPIGPQARVLWKPPVCSPCINVHQGKVASCIHTRPECMVNITPDEVWSWVGEQLGEPPARLHLFGSQPRAQDA